MLHNDAKEKALAEHKKAIQQRDDVYETVQTEYAQLDQTHKRAIELIESTEDFINSLANTPKKFARTIARINVERKVFRKTEEYAAEAEKAVWESGFRVAVGGAVGGTAGRAAAKVTPDAIKWVATTFEKSPAGTNFSTLLGVLKSKAVLAGPMIGISIFVLNTAFSLVALDCKNKTIAEQVIEEANAARVAHAKLIEICAGISQLHSETEELMGRISEQLKSLELLRDCNYAELSGDEKLQLGSLVNQTLALAEMLN